MNTYPNAVSALCLLISLYIRRRMQLYLHTHENALKLKRAVRCDTGNGESPLGNCAATT